MPTPSSPWGQSSKVGTVWSTGEVAPISACFNFWRSRRAAGYFYKECPTGQQGSGAYVIVPEGKFASALSQADADNLAREYLLSVGPTYANVNGTCELGQFIEIFSNLTGALNWDWIDNKDTDFPHRTGYIFAANNSPGRNLVLLPMIALVTFTAPVVDVQAATNAFTPTQGLNYDIHDPHGLMHVDVRNWHTEQATLVVEWGEVLAGAYGEAGADLSANVTYRQANYYSMLIADFGSTEVHQTANMGGAMFELVTTRRKLEDNGKISGSYFVCYSDIVRVFTYDPGIEDYAEVYSVAYSMKEVTSYWGASIILDEFGEFKSELYLNGAWQLDISDNDLIHIKPCPYMRGETSLDFWFGDVFVGRINYFTNRIPPVLHAVYLQPTSISAFPPTESELSPTKWYIPPTTVVGAEEAKDANNLPVSLAGGTATIGFQGHWPDYKDSITIQGFGQTFAQAHLWVNFDYRAGGLPPKPYGCTALIAHQFRTMAYLKDEIPGINRQFLVPLPNSEYTNVQLPENPFMGNHEEESIWDFYFANGTDFVRSQCWNRWNTAYRHPMDLDYRIACDNIDLVTRTEGKLFDLEQLATYWYKPAAGWQGAEVFSDVYSEIRGFFFKTGTAGIRTRDTLEAPVYDPPECPKAVNCENYSVLLTFPGLVDEQGGDLFVSTGQICDSLYPGLYNVAQGGWNWTVVVTDMREVNGSLYGPRNVRVTVSMISPELMDAYLASSSQLRPFLNVKEIILRAYVVGPGKVDKDNQLSAWPIPVYEAKLKLAGASLNVPPLPPSGGPGLPPEATMIYQNEVAGASSTQDPAPILFAEGFEYRFEIFDANRPYPPIDYLENV